VRGVGEVPIVPPQAAIRNAIYDAIGVRFYHTPMPTREQYPGMRRVLLDEGALRGEVAIAINAVVTENDVTEPVEDSDEIFLLPAIAGGAACG
jgi:hypothetical protein